MRIGIDIDDTITDSYDDIISAYSAYSNVDKSKFINNKITYEDLLKNRETSDYKEFTKKNFERIIPNVKPKKHAKEVIDILHNLGFQIEIVTARNFVEYSDPHNISVEYLKRNKIYYDRINTGIYDKGLLCKDHKIDILIDDSINNLNKARKYGIKTILFGNVFNEDNQEFTRVNSWVELLNLLTENMQN